MAPSRFALASIAAVTATAMKCPGSSAWLTHAGMEVTVEATASCADVAAEIKARASGQSGWVDPHNGGDYSVLDASPTEVHTQRKTNAKTSVGGKVYTDKQVFSLTQQGGTCAIEACSESQGSSYKDFSTNYCDLRNLYCGSTDGCKPILHDFSSSEKSTKAKAGADHDFSKCIVKKDVADETIEVNNSLPLDGTCAKPGDCGRAYQACCAGFAAKGEPCGCHLKDGDGKSADNCGTCGTAYSVCCAGFQAKGFPCTCDIGAAGQASLVV